jgi:hypothetical protein
MIPITIPFFSLKEVADGFRNGDSHGGYSNLHLGCSMLFSNLLYLVSRMYYIFSKKKDV